MSVRNARSIALVFLSLTLAQLPLGHSIALPFVTATVAGDAENGQSSIATQGGQKIIEDSFGRFLAIYVDTSGRVGVTFANSNPTLASSWAVPVKAFPAVQYRNPAAVLASLTSLRIIVEDGPGRGAIRDLPVAIQRDSQSKIIGVSFGTPLTLDASGRAEFPAAILAHNGDILAVWNWLDTLDSSKVKAFRWRAGTGWTSFTGSGGVPDDGFVDTLDRVSILPNIIQRQDNHHVYVVGNRDENSLTQTIVFNKASFDGSNWSWGVQNLSYETNAARGLFDLPSLVWDPVRNLVVAAYDVSGSTKYGVFTLDALDLKRHVDTPTLIMGNNEWGSLTVDAATGDYYLFTIDTIDLTLFHDNGMVGYTRRSGGSWDASLNIIDGDTNNIGISLRRTGATADMDLVYQKSGALRFVRLSLPNTSRSYIPTDDATVSPDLPNTNFGSDTGLTVDNSPVKNFLLKFSVTGLSCLVTSAILQLYDKDPSDKGGDFFQAADTWAETTATWNNAPAAQSTRIASLGLVSAGVTYDVNVTSIVTGNGVVSLRVTTASTNGAIYSSKEGANPPLLTITFRCGGDTSPPTTPGSLTAKVVTETRVDLSWKASTDNVGVVGYDVLRNGTKIGTVGTTTTAYSDTTAQPSHSYTYTVVAFDAAGNRSSPGGPATAVMPRGGVLAPTDDAYVLKDSPTSNFGSATTVRVDNSPVVHFLLRFSVSGVGDQSVLTAKLRLFNLDPSDKGGDFFRVLDTNWNQSTVNWNNAPAADSTPLASLGQVAAGNWYEIDLKPIVTGDGPVSLRVSSTSTNGALYSSKEGTNPPQLIFTITNCTGDCKAPSQPQNLAAVAVSGTRVDLSWQASTDNIAVAGYEVFRDSTKISTVGGATTAYSDTTAQPATTYTYVVVAFDAANNHSPPSNTAKVTTPGGRLVFKPTDDASVLADFPTMNFGKDTTLQTDLSSLENFLLRFSVTGVSSGKVTSAKLRLFNVNPSIKGGDFHRVGNNNWTETTITWNNGPAADTSVLASLGAVSTGIWYEVDLTALIGGDGVFSIRVTSTSSDGADYSSKEGTNPPELVVTFS